MALVNHQDSQGVQNYYPSCQTNPHEVWILMRLETTPPQTPREAEIRRQAHAKAILKGITMRQAVFEALELWLKEQNAKPKQT